MKARLILCCAVLISGGAVAFGSAQPADVLAPMRAALGGDAALDAVMRFSVTGTLTRHMSGTGGSTGYEVLCEFPDKFLTTARSTVDVSGLPPGIRMPSTSTVSSTGFNAGQPIRRVSGDTLPGGMPSVIRAPGPTDPDEIAAEQRRQVSNAHREFLRFVLPRFGKSFPGSPVQVESAGNATVDGHAVYQVKVTDWGNRVHVLAIDAATNLPVRLTWQDRPVVSMNLGTVMNTGVAAGTPPTFPKFPADPTAGMPDAEHVITFRKFKIENGLNWPREISKTVDGRPTEDWSLGKVNLSPKFKADTFSPSK